MFKKTLISGLVAAACTAGSVPAQTPPAAPAAPASPHTLTGNFGFFSQYIFRGLTQTNRKPALQGGFDYAHESGFYLGTWGSNISWLKENLSSTGGGISGQCLTVDGGLLHPLVSAETQQGRLAADGYDGGA